MKTKPYNFDEHRRDSLSPLLKLNCVMSSPSTIFRSCLKEKSNSFSSHSIICSCVSGCGGDDGSAIIINI